MKYSTLLTVAFGALMLASFGSTGAQASELCREYTKTIVINGKLETGKGIACQRSDNTWEIMELNGKELARNVVQDRIYNDLSNEGYRIVSYSNNDRYVHTASIPVYFGSYQTPKKYNKKYKNHKRSYKQNYVRSRHRY